MMKARSKVNHKHEQHFFSLRNGKCRAEASHAAKVGIITHQKYIAKETGSRNIRRNAIAIYFQENRYDKLLQELRGIRQTIKLHTTWQFQARHC
jgi:hypothetical protein